MDMIINLRRLGKRKRKMTEKVRQAANSIRR